MTNSRAPRNPWTVPALGLVLVLAFTGLAGAQAPERRFPVSDDLLRLKEVEDPQLSPDGAWVAYAVNTAEVAKDRRVSHLWMTSWDGSQTLPLTQSAEGEHSPRWSPDGRYLAFLSSRGYANEVDQLWLLDRSGGEAQRVTDIKAGITELAWAPDGKRLVLVVQDGDSAVPTAIGIADSAKSTSPKPIVIDRFYFKEDVTGYLLGRRTHLYLFDLATRTLEPLTTGSNDEIQPSWSPDGKRIAFFNKAGADPDRTLSWNLYVIEARAGAEPKLLTTFVGSDNDAYAVSPLSWSPDGQWIAFVRGDSEKLIYYGVQRLAIVPSGGGEVRILAADLDRNVSLPRWSPDAKSILCLVEDDRTQYLARVSVADGHLEPAVGGRRVISDFTSAPASDRWAVISATAREPDEVYALQGSELRRLSHQNDSLLAAIQLGGIEEISFPSKDGTVINGFLITPPDYIPGRRYPTLLRLHGGPTLQAENALDANGYLGLYLHILAARGYAVLSVNPRGSSGRGEKFASAIFADWGNKDAQDVLAAVDYAVARGVADPSRLGIGGWSYGAILTNYVITQDHRFRAATSGAGMSNMLAGYGTDQYVREWELELGTPWTRAATYLRLSAPFLHADRITTPTLFLGGEKDFNVPLPNGEQMYQALRSLGRPTALIIYPGEFHGIRRPSFVKDRMERYLAWYDRFLRKGGIDSSAIQPGIAR